RLPPGRDLPRRRTPQRTLHRPQLPLRPHGPSRLTCRAPAPTFDRWGARVIRRRHRPGALSTLDWRVRYDVSSGDTLLETSAADDFGASASVGLERGAALGRDVVLERLGAGAMGVVS